MAAQTSAERQAAYKARQAILGRAEVRGIFLPPDKHAEVKAYAKKLQKQKKPVSR